MVYQKLRKFKPDVIFNALHGRYGEDGYIQLILENEKLNILTQVLRLLQYVLIKLVSKRIFFKKKILSPAFGILKKT